MRKCRYRYGAMNFFMGMVGRVGVVMYSRAGRKEAEQQLLASLDCHDLEPLVAIFHFLQAYTPNRKQSNSVVEWFENSVMGRQAVVKISAP